MSHDLAVERLRAGIARLSGPRVTPTRSDVDHTRRRSPDAFAPFPLTDMQEAYWIGRQNADLALGGLSIHSYHETEITDLAPQRLEQAWHALVRRHDMLRAIVTEDGQQRVLEEIEIPDIPIDDLRHLQIEDREARLATTRATMSHRTHELGQWPLWEIRLSLLDNDTTRIHLGIDGIVVDDRSYQILIREWFLLYDGRDRELAPLTFTFRDYVLKERALQSSEAYRKALDYWTAKIEHLPKAPQLPQRGDLTVLGQVTFTRKASRLFAPAWARIKEICSARKITPPSLVLSAFVEVLSLWSKEPEVTVNVPTFSRLPLHPQVNDLVGEFGSFVLISNEGLTTLPFGERVQALQKRLWEALEHGQVSGVRILRELTRRTGDVEGARMPVVFTMASNLNRETGDGDADGHRGDVLFGISQTPQVLLDHQSAELRGVLHFNWDVVDTAFPEGMVDDMFGAFCDLLRRIGDGAPVWDETVAARLPDWQTRERSEANRTDAPLSSALLHEAVDKRMAMVPNDPAILTADRTLTFRDLDQRAEAIAEVLVNETVRPGDRVAIVALKGWEQVAAALGILRIGGVYLPIGADLPPLRRNRLLDRAGVRVAVTQSSLVDDLDWPAALTIVTVPDRGPLGAGGRPLPETDPDKPAYVLFTSGSTGEPKAVVMSHRAAVNTLDDIVGRFGIGSSDRVLGLSQLSFDLSVFDIFGVLGAGGGLVLPSPDHALDPAAWATLCAQHHVTVWNSVPALVSLLIQHLEDTDATVPADLQVVMMSGDWIPLDLPDRMRRKSRHPLKLISLGGATEAAIWSVFNPIDEIRPGWNSIPYGRPLTNQKLHVLKPTLADCPVWVPGRLYIEGVGLALAYLGDPDQTSAKFVHDAASGRRLYDTGDLALYRPGGDIEFLGREDRQVKIRGHRVDLREVELALCEHPAVHTAVVVNHATGQLSGFVVPATPDAPDGPPSPAELRTFLQDRLPRHMLPGDISWIDHLPLSRDGKVSVDALRAAASAQDNNPLHTDPGDNIAAKVSALFATVSGVTTPDMHRSPIELGANSMELIRLSGLIRRDFGVDIPLVELLQVESLTALSHQICKRSGRPTADEICQETHRDPPHRPPRPLSDPLSPHDPGAVIERRRRATASGSSIRLSSDGNVDNRIYRQSARASCRRFSLRPIPPDTIGRLLDPLVAVEIDGRARFRYGSASGLYPVDTYCEVKPGRLTGLLPGLYVYDPLRHRLVERAPGRQVDGTAYGDRNRAIVDDAAFTIFFICSLDAIRPTYGDFSIELAMYEAGSMGQLLRERGADLGIGLCSLGTMHFSDLRTLLRLDADAVFLHAIAGGLRPPGRSLIDDGTVDQAPIDRLADLADRLLDLSDSEAQSLLAAIKAAQP